MLLLSVYDAWLTSTARRINWCANVRALIRRGDGPGHATDWPGWSPTCQDTAGKVWRYCRRAYTWKLCGRGGLNGKDKALKWINGPDGKVAHASHLMYVRLKKEVVARARGLSYRASNSLATHSTKPLSTVAPPVSSLPPSAMWPTAGHFPPCKNRCSRLFA